MSTGEYTHSPPDRVTEIMLVGQADAVWVVVRYMTPGRMGGKAAHWQMTSTVGEARMYAHAYAAIHGVGVQDFIDL